MTDVTSARTDGDDIVLELLPDGEELRVDAVLVATGGPNGDQLRLAEHGYAMDDAGYVVTDTHLRTSVDGVFALVMSRIRCSSSTCQSRGTSRRPQSVEP